MFVLFVDAKNKEMTISSTKPGDAMTRKATAVPTRWNSSYFICNDRAVLREFAKEAKENWISTLEQDLADVRAIKIKTKY